jgi:hypothetical protein
VAATDNQAKPPAEHRRAASILAAALALPGVVSPVHAENAPEKGEIAFKYLYYRDWQPAASVNNGDNVIAPQPSLERIRVKAPSVYGLMPIGQHWSIEGSSVIDDVSGASPRYHSSVSSASKMDDRRYATDVKVTRYQDRSAYAIGASLSRENDYRSRSATAEARFSTEDNNRTWNIGVGFSNDTIEKTGDPTYRRDKHVAEVGAGVTQALSPYDLVQFNLTYSHGSCKNDPTDPNPDTGAREPSCYSDVYKTADLRPDKRNQTIVLTRWNHYFAGWGTTLRTNYRYYTDNFGIKAHTLGAEWVQPLNAMFTLTPSVRLYTQSAADFYFDPIYDPGNPGYPPGFFTNPPRYSSPDQRLSAFGAYTAGVKLGVKLTPDWSADLKGEYYEQRGDWRVGGDGSPGLAPFKATFWQVGSSYRF